MMRWYVLVLLGSVSYCFAADQTVKEDPVPTPAADKKEVPKINIRFIYSLCNDVREIKKFYADVLQMKPGSYQEKDGHGWAVYDSTGIQLMFFTWDDKLTKPDGWAWQPGDGKGKEPRMSLSVEIPDNDFQATVKRIRDAKFDTMSESPTWRQDSYWGWTVKDPAGSTVEVYSTPKEKPADKDPHWKD